MKRGKNNELSNYEELIIEDDDRLKCPHCRRKFNPDPYERHLPICPRNKNRFKLKL